MDPTAIKQCSQKISFFCKIGPEFPQNDINNIFPG